MHPDSPRIRAGWTRNVVSVLARTVLLLVIRVYWLVVPEGRRRNCLFRTSCSRHVFLTTQANGFLEGCRALRERWRRCRSGYRVELEPSGYCLILADGTKAVESEIVPGIFEPHRAALERARQTVLAGLTEPTTPTEHDHGLGRSRVSDQIELDQG